MSARDNANGDAGRTGTRTWDDGGGLAGYSPAARHGRRPDLREFLAIEVKAQSRFSTPQLVGLRAIGELPRLARRILVYLGDRELRMEDGIEIWPFDRFTKAAADRLLWP